MKNLTGKNLLKIFTSILVEFWPILIIVGLLTVDVAQFSGGPWQYYFLYQGDSLVLPLVHSSFASHSPFYWQFSSQVFLFPEYAIYYFCSLITNSVRVSLILNAYANVLLLYLVFRFLVNLISDKSRLQKCFFALLPVSLYLLFVWLEPLPDYGYSSIATFFLFTTYYYGVILSGLTALALSIWGTNNLDKQARLTKRFWISSTFIVLIGVLTTFSDPLYIMQFYLPFMLSIGLLWLINRLSIRITLIIGALNTFAVCLGYALRHLLARFVDSGLRGYINTNKIPASLTVLHVSLSQLLSSDRGALKLCLIVILITWSIAYLLYVTYKQFRSGSKKLQPVYVLISSFVAASSITLFIGFILTGSVTTRYLIPLAIFPLLMVLLLSNLELKFKHLRAFTYTLLGLSLVVVLALTNNASPSFSKMAGGKNYTYAACLEKWAGGKDLDGLANYYVARQLELYSTKNIFTIQATSDLSVHPWLINLGLYENKNFSFVLVQNKITVQSVAPLGTPSSITDCPGYTIYNYSHTSGQLLLNQRIQSTLQIALHKAGFNKNL